MENIHIILEELVLDEKTNRKLEVLKKHKDNELLKKVLYYTYNPFYQFYVKKYPKNDTFSNESNINHIFDYLDKLRNREITGNAAIDMVYILRSKLNEKDALLLDKILQKDLKVKVNVKSINKVFDNLIPTFNYMGAISYNKKKFDKLLNTYKQLEVQIKEDGLFCNLIVNDDIKTLARNGKELHLERVFENVNLSNRYVYTGEVLVKGYDRYSANGIVNSYRTIIEKQKNGKDTFKEENFYKRYNKTLREIEKDIYIVLWDMIPFEHWSKGYYDLPYNKRLELLKNEVNKSNKTELVKRWILDNKKDIMNKFREVLNEGLEGLIVKNPIGIWQDGKNEDAQKFKIIIDLDLVIKDLLFGNKGTKYENKINRVVCETSDGLLCTQVAGLKEKDMDFITENKDNLIGKIVTIKCYGLSEDRNNNHSVLHPSFVTIRDDKDEANTLEECKEIEKSVFEIGE